jgi:uncharacterized membrane protein YhaH (DUF805 family)
MEGGYFVVQGTVNDGILGLTIALAMNEFITEFNSFTFSCNQRPLDIDNTNFIVSIIGLCSAVIYAIAEFARRFHDRRVQQVFQSIVLRAGRTASTRDRHDIKSSGNSQTT